MGETFMDFVVLSKTAKVFPQMNMESPAAVLSHAYLSERDNIQHNHRGLDPGVPCTGWTVQEPVLNYNTKIIIMACRIIRFRQTISKPIDLSSGNSRIN